VNIYLIEAKFNVTWDEHDSFVVLAPTEDKAREIVNTPTKGHYVSPKDVWLAPSKASCTKIGTGRGPSRVVCASFNAG
jgi:hypothetical protein